jgi:hypothetical protein
METLCIGGVSRLSFAGSHSLGILIEWKPTINKFVGGVNFCSHSLGILIEWKRKW